MHDVLKHLNDADPFDLQSSTLRHFSAPKHCARPGRRVPKPS